MNQNVFKNEGILADEELLFVGTRVPKTTVRLIDQPVLTGRFESRAEALRVIIHSFLSSEEAKRYGFAEDDKIAKSLAILAEITSVESTSRRFHQQLAILEITLGEALKARDRTEVEIVLSAVQQAWEHLSPFWKHKVEKSLVSSTVYILALERYGEKYSTLRSRLEVSGMVSPPVGVHSKDSPK